MSSRDEEKEQKEAGEKGSLPAGSSISSKLVMEDPEATDNFITHKLTKKLQLPSEATVMSVKVVGECQRRVMKHTSVYKICLSEMYGRKHEVETISRPYGKVQLMLGMSSQSLHCTDGMKAGELRLFYSGWVLTGCANVSCHTN